VLTADDEDEDDLTPGDEDDNVLCLQLVHMKECDVSSCLADEVS